MEAKRLDRFRGYRRPRIISSCCRAAVLFTDQIISTPNAVRAQRCWKCAKGIVHGREGHRTVILCRECMRETTARNA